VIDLLGVVTLSAVTLFFLLKSRRNYMSLPELPSVSGAGSSDLTVIIPARNEAHQIARAVSGFKGVPVIVVDDHSDDDTAAVADRAGALLIKAPPLSENARGKPNACLAGARHATTRWICFIDADTWFEPCFASSLVAYAVQHNLDMVSAFLRSHRITAAEKLLLPYAFALYFTGVNSKAVNDPKSSQALANGQCILFRSESYWRIGGHQSVMASVIEDVSIAAVAKHFQIASQVVRAEQLGHVRMYDGLRAIWNGFRKNSFRFLGMNPATGLQVIVSSILLTSWLPVALCLIANRRFTAATLMELAILLMTPIAGLWPWYGSFWALSSPLAIYLFQSIALDGMLSALTPRKAVWKGRRV
jgi:hypothetical protein